MLGVTPEMAFFLFFFQIVNLLSVNANIKVSHLAGFRS